MTAADYIATVSTSTDAYWTQEGCTVTMVPMTIGRFSGEVEVIGNCTGSDPPPGFERWVGALTAPNGATIGITLERTASGDYEPALRTAISTMTP